MSFIAAVGAWLVEKLGDSLLGAWMKPTLEKRIRSAVEAWRRSLPADFQDNEFWPSALLAMGSLEGRPEEASRKLREAFDSGFPDEKRWLDALLEQWRELHPRGGVAFLRAPEEVARKHLEALARSLQRVCAEDPRLALPALLAASQARSSNKAALEPEIERAKTALNGGALDVGWELLQALRTQHWEELSSRERYRVQALQAHVLMRRGRTEEAGALFVEAAANAPEDDKAKAHHALGRLLLRQNEEAFRIAKDVLARGPDSTAAVVFIAAAPRDTSAGAIEAELPPHLLREADVARQLARRARVERDFERAERHARIASAATPDALESQSELARVLAQSVLAGLTDEPTSIAPELREVLGEARKLLTSALTRDPTREEAAQLRLDRSVVTYVLGDPRQSEADVHEAYALAPEHPPAAIREADLRREAGDLEGALAALLPAKKDPAVAVVRARMLKNAGTSAALRDARRTLGEVRKEVERAEPFLRAEYCYEVVAVQCLAGDFDEAERFLDATSSDVVAPPALRLALLSMVAINRNERGRAKELASEAVKQVSRDDEPDVRRLVAVALERAGLADSALGIWSTLVDPRIPTGDAHRFIACALKTGNDLAAMEFCRAARNAGVHDKDLLEVQVSLCERYNSLSEAIEIISEEREAERDPNRAAGLAVAGAYYAMRLGRADLMRAFAESMPPAGALDPHRGRAVVQVYRALGRTADAVNFAYEMVRQHPDDREARIGLLDAMGFGGGAEGPRREFDAIAAGAAARVHFDLEDRDEWYVVDDREDALFARREFRSSHPHVMALLGRRVGERFEIPGPIQDKTGTVREIISKEAFVLRQALETWDLAFPEDSTVVGVKLETGATPQERLAPMLRMIDERHRFGTEALEVYQREVVPAFAVGTSLGIQTGFDAFLEMAADAAISVKCCESGEIATGITRAASINTECVVDPTGLATLFLFDADALLESEGIRFIVTEGTLQELRQSPILNEGGRKTGTVGKVGDQYVFTEARPDNASKARARLQQFIEHVERRCVRVSGVALAKLPPKIRTALPEIVGLGSAEAMAVSRDRGCVLWTDDFGVAKLAESDLRVGRITTQWLALVLQAQGKIASPFPELLSTGMLLRGYRTTALNSAAVSYAVLRAGGDPAEQSLRRVLEYMGSDEVTGMGIPAAVVRALSDAAAHRLPTVVLEELARRFSAIVVRKTLGRTLCAHIAAELRRNASVEGFSAMADMFEQHNR